MSRPDQIEVASQAEADSKDQDSTMDDVEISTYTPSDSQDPSEESTLASTLAENRAENAPAEIDSLKPFEQEDVADDVTMKDVGPRQNEPAGAGDRFSDPKVVSWPSSTVIDPGSSPWKAEKTNEEIVDYGSDPQKLEELLRIHETDSPENSKH